jgi:hypothetical protein
MKACKLLIKVRFTIFFTPLFALQFRDLLDAAARDEFVLQENQ